MPEANLSSLKIVDHLPFRLISRLVIKLSTPPSYLISFCLLSSIFSRVSIFLEISRDFQKKYSEHQPDSCFKISFFLWRSETPSLSDQRRSDHIQVFGTRCSFPRTAFGSDLSQQLSIENLITLTLDFKRLGMWKVLGILIFGLASADENDYEIVSCNDPNKESL